MSSDSTIWATVAAALAAIFSAITAWLSLRLQRRVSREAIRPELILAECLGPDEQGNFEIRSIRNVGRGPAYDIEWDLKLKERPKAYAAVHYNSVSIIPPNEERPVNALCFFDWEEWEGKDNVHLELSVSCHDSNGYGCETRMHLAVARTPLGAYSSVERVARDLYCLSRDRFTRSPLQLLWIRRMRTLKSKFKKKVPTFRPSPMKDEKG